MCCLEFIKLKSVDSGHKNSRIIHSNVRSHGSKTLTWSDFNLILLSSFTERSGGINAASTSVCRSIQDCVKLFVGFCSLTTYILENHMTGRPQHASHMLLVKNSIQIVYMHTRLTVNGFLKVFLKTGGVYLTEISRLYLGEKEIRSHQ
jgi:hypothetical protein